MSPCTTLDQRFPQAAWYNELRRAARCVRERPADARRFPYSERHVQCLWFDDAHRPARLLAATGEEVTVVAPGRWNLEAGPDFLDAVLEIGPERRRVAGDVEVHIRPADWTAHRHGRDPAYRRVVAHVTWFDGTPGPTPGPTVMRIPLQASLQRDPVLVFEAIDVAAYPYAAAPSTPAPCAVALAEWGPDARGRLLDAAGAERIRVKAERLALNADEAGRDQALYDEVMAALGYKQNRGPFRQLARRMPLAALREESAGDAATAYALLLGVAGLLPATTPAAWDDATRAFVRQLWDAWWKRQARWGQAAMGRSAWTLAGLRPHNHPVRRLAAAAALVTAPTPLAERLAAVPVGDAERWCEETAALFRDTTRFAYWNRRLALGGKPQAVDVQLLGEERIAAILANVALPWRAAEGVDVAHLLAMLPREQDNALTRRTAHCLFGRDHNRKLYGSGMRQQGLIQIFNDFCLTSRNQCLDCRLAESLRGQPVDGR